MCDCDECKRYGKPPVDTTTPEFKEREAEVFRRLRDSGFTAVPLICQNGGMLIDISEVK